MLTRRTFVQTRRHRRRRRAATLDRRARPREQPVGGVRADAASASSPASICLSSNENPHGARARPCSTRSRPRSARPARAPGRYSTRTGALIDAIAKKFNIKPENIVLGCGSTQILRSATHLFTATDKAARRHDSDLRGVRRLRGDDGPSGPRASRSTPTSRSISTRSPTPRRAPGWSSTAIRTTRRRPTSARARRASSSRKVAKRRRPTRTMLVDEAYFDYVTDPDHDTHIPLAVEDPHVIVARTFSKAYGMAGLRMGYCDRPRRHDQEDGRLGRRRPAPAR